MWGSTNLRRFRSGLHPDYRSTMKVDTVSMKRAADSAAAVRTRGSVVVRAPPPSAALQELPRMRALRDRIAAKEARAREAC